MGQVCDERARAGKKDEKRKIRKLFFAVYIDKE
jgi:hypothetical protein